MQVPRFSRLKTRYGNRDATDFARFHTVAYVFPSENSAFHTVWQASKRKRSSWTLQANKLNATGKALKKDIISEQPTDYQHITKSSKKCVFFIQKVCRSKYSILVQIRKQVFNISQLTFAKGKKRYGQFLFSPHEKFSPVFFFCLNMIIYPMRRSRCFVFWQLCSNCQILTLSKPKRTVTPYMYICLPNLCPSGFSV